jgi:hypothetical protein
MYMYTDEFERAKNIRYGQVSRIYASNKHQMYIDIKKYFSKLQRDSKHNSNIYVEIFTLGHGTKDGFYLERGVDLFGGGPIGESENLNTFIGIISSLSANYPDIVNLKLFFTQCYSNSYNYTNSPKLSVHHHPSITNSNPYSKNDYLVCGDIITWSGFPLLIDLYEMHSK